jgi:hypothetical protein
MTDDAVTRSNEPQGPLAHLAAGMTKDLPDDVQAIVMLHDETNGMVHLHGYDEENGESDALSDLFTHMKAIFRANGSDLAIIPVEMPTN